MTKRTFVGFGFGAIQAGLFLYEAQRSGNFGRLVVAEVVPEVVGALHQSRGSYRVNVATRTGVERHEVTGIEVYNPNHRPDRQKLVAAVADADELSTVLPSVDFFDRGEHPLAALLAEGLTRKLQDSKAPPAVLYTAENNNHAAAILTAAIRGRLPKPDAMRLAEKFQVLDTVIGKMSRVVLDQAEIREATLATVTDSLARAFLVEEFNRILVSRISLSGFQRGIT
ncbi:hypothetical protein HQ590_12380, partial [bacterium]|nr:hypothetical protein [bacterium]